MVMAVLLLVLEVRVPPASPMAILRDLAVIITIRTKISYTIFAVSQNLYVLAVLTVNIGWDQAVFESYLAQEAKATLVMEKPRRPVELKKPPADFALTRHHAASTVIATRGDRMSVPCGDCHNGLGPYSSCFRYTANMPLSKIKRNLNNGACAGCIARNVTADCDYSKSSRDAFKFEITNCTRSCIWSPRSTAFDAEVCYWQVKQV